MPELSKPHLESCRSFPTMPSEFRCNIWRFTFLVRRRSISCILRKMCVRKFVALQINSESRGQALGHYKKTKCRKKVWVRYATNYKYVEFDVGHLSLRQSTLK